MRGKKVTYLFIVSCLLVLSQGCVYFNTFYNGRKAFNEAESARKASLSKGREVIQGKRYQIAVDKSLKVIENNPGSGYYDDALFILGVSYYYLKQYGKSERRLRELMANYTDSKYYDDATLYLAKAKLLQEDESDATEIFESIFRGEFKKSYKSEAALALGQYYFELKEYEKAEPYLLAIRDSLGNDVDQRRAQNYIADGKFNQFDFGAALGSYLQLLGMDLDDKGKYRALYQSAVCSFNLQRIQDGMDYLNKLINDEIYYDSLSVLRLKLAEGYELDGELLPAEVIYQEVADESKNNKLVAEANYNLGLIYQFEYDDLTTAKEYYDAAAKASRSTFAGQDAFQRSTDIGKLEEFTEKVSLDSSATNSQIDAAAARQFELAELYWFKLDKPDSALTEIKYLIKTFPSAYDAPNAMIAQAGMEIELNSDSVKSDSLLKAVIIEYPGSDYLPEALEALGLKGTPADTGYAGYYLRRAEDFLIDSEEIDSAIFNYQYVVDNYPDSKYFLQATFSLIWLAETYQSPGDSSVYYAYQEFADSFPGTDWGQLAKQKTRSQRGGILNRDESAVDTVKSTEIDDALPGQENLEEEDYYDPFKSIYRGPSGDTIPLFSAAPRLVNEPFIYPTEAYYTVWSGDLYFQIKLDFAGEVIDYKMMTKSESPELDRRARVTVATMEFDPLDVSKIVSNLELTEAAEGGGYWFVYKYRVLLPDHLR